MVKIIKSRIVVFAISIALSYLLPVIYQDILGFILILSIGVIHGANDLLIIKKYTRKNSLKRQISYFFYYLGLVFLGFVFFYLFPSIALLSFVLVSIYHFGEQHWEVSASNSEFVNIKRIYPIILHGLIFFVIVFMNNINIVNDVLLSFNTISLNYTFLRILLIVLFLIYMSLLLSSKSIRGYLVDEFIFFILLFLLTLNSSLIFGFSIYFIFFHSVLSIKDQVKYIYGDDNSQYIKKYLISALPYFILALLFLIGFYLFIDFESLDILPIMFTFLAAITFPHVIVIEKMYSSMK
jgi:Brp/Blh family beta-carotene 15,15'-monooxygenase